VAGNWKMHGDPQMLEAFCQDLSGVAYRDTEVVLFPPALFIPQAVRALEAVGNVNVGIQNVHWRTSGAFTGEIAAGMAAQSGCRHALVGHSERRLLHAEDDDTTRRKFEAVRKAGMTPILCIGETREERMAGRSKAVTERQLSAILAAVNVADGDFIVAYEPVWAIGTKVTPQAEEIAAMHEMISTLLDSRTPGLGSRIRILYGGSVTDANATRILAIPRVDGVLVGGACLNSRTFLNIIASAEDYL